jgi:hypothetical protein
MRGDLHVAEGFLQARGKGRCQSAPGRAPEGVLVAPERRSPEYLQKSIQGEIEKWATLIKAANIEAE